ncbi:phasin family protein [Paraburkholderia sp. RL17-337-BIB-A]|uniref:phasin family protein n=1 Tax=Paraburkholderia sp. RL17-337-BIB-A TaxID=3031636 RepID=UPI0038BC7E5D
MGSVDPEQQLTAAQKAGFEAVFSVFTKAFEDTEKLVELNLQAVKSTLAEHQEILAKTFSVKDLHELFGLQASHAQPPVEKAQSYWRHVYEIISSTQSGFAAAAEAQLQQHHRGTHQFVDKLAKKAPAGSEAAVAAWKAFIKTASETASATYEAARKATKQAVEIVDSNVSAASPALAKRTRQAVVPVEAVQK